MIQAAEAFRHVSTAPTGSQPLSAPSRTWWALGGAILLVAAHAYALTLPWDLRSPLVVANHLFAVALLAGLFWLAAALGLRLLRAFGLGRDIDLENIVFALGLGLGGLAYLVMACGLLHILQAWILVLVLACGAIAVRRELAELLAVAPTLCAAWSRHHAQLRQERIFRLVLPIAEITVVLTAVRALAPPIGYDALLYHLPGPLEFLRLGGLAPLGDLPQANMPFTVDMLYLLGLAFGSDELSSLLHLSFALLTGAATFSLGRRMFSLRLGCLAAAAFVSAPALTVYGPVANIDYGWAFFDFLAVYAFLIWLQAAQVRWLTIAGLAAGLSLGSKYFGLITVVAIAIGIIAVGLRPGRGRLMQSLALFFVPATLVAAPWYLKNWLWFGNPVWPFLDPSGVVDSGLYFAGHMNSGRGLEALPLLPLRLYLGDFADVWARPPLAFLLVPLYVVVRKHRAVTYLATFSLLHFVVWSQGIQTVRYLSPIFPALSVVCAYVAVQLLGSDKLRGVLRIPTFALLVYSMVIGASASLIMASLERPFAQLVGLESRQAYLRRNLEDYDAIRYVNEHRTQIDRLLVIGGLRTYYLTPPASIDQNLDLFSELATASDPTIAQARLQEAGVSHVLFSRALLDWLSHFDPEERVIRWQQAFEHTRGEYLLTEFTSPAADVYRLSSSAPLRDAATQ